jgi:hypothetical protein
MASSAKPKYPKKRKEQATVAQRRVSRLATVYGSERQ